MAFSAVAVFVTFMSLIFNYKKSNVLTLVFAKNWLKVE